MPMTSSSPDAHKSNSNTKSCRCSKHFCTRGLELLQEKTSITHIENGFDFLGQNVRKYNGKLLIKPSKKNIQSFLEKVRAIIKDHKQVTIGQLICISLPSEI